MKDNSAKLNIRYLGFESLRDGSRRLDYSITSPGKTPRRVSFEIPSFAFTGERRVTFQESAALCYEKLRVVLDQQSSETELFFRITQHDIDTYRPRGRRAAARTKA
jgi:hypothetical protein